MAKSKKQTKTEQANMQSDAMTSDGILWSGSGDMTYSFADIDDTFDYQGPQTSYTVDGLNHDYDDEQLRKKYPALKDAWDHYQSVKHMCKMKESEDED